MFRTMEQCTEKIFSLRKVKDARPHEQLRRILQLLGNPEATLQFVHVAGSNGKGSTIAMLRALCEASGLRVGVFTSPHLTRVNERIVVDGMEITDEAFLRHMNRLDEIIQTHFNGAYPNFFEVVTIIAFMHFAEMKPAIVLLETGLGGRLDATNVITPLVAIITTISLEHTELLGDTYALIAKEKAGIIKPGVPVVTGVQNKEALAVIQQVAHENAAPCYALYANFDAKAIVQYETAQRFDYVAKGITWSGLELTMQGTHQAYNAAVALTAMRCLTEELHFVFKESIAKFALTHVNWAGRFEVVDDIVLDGAHNVEGVTSLLDTLASVYPDTPFDVLYASLQDKDYTTAIALIEERAKSMMFTQMAMPNAVPMLSLYEIAKHPKKMLVPRWQDVITNHTPGRLLVVTGSLYFVAEVRKFMLNRVGGRK
ncbi:bifunctional folylpolyglutamate synthase/dihydrofolate synthase [Metalysinibacillus jejuensis]|uniref:bifunctional folylpolyglutamate synthase/dihydrofolate synthase n=1 Tax=Metalysinibacillus jejuensis TaxID=914327 RepID=UPI000D346C49|nr:folylpolyglutamate synthase/dihydrofolate synthase family protein [Metalysinibacillus jejuensis]